MLGRPSCDPRVERLARGVAWIATLWFAAAACWEIAGPFGAGHVASSAGVGIAGENMWTWHILAPVPHYSAVEPATGDYYCHHPWGVFWTTALLVRVFGHYDWVCRLPPILMSTATVPLLYALGRALWGPAAGALSAAAFVVLPISLAFANFNALEVPVMFGVLLASFGLVRFTRTWRWRFLALSLLGLLHALNSDWPAFVFAGLVILLLPLRLLPAINGSWYRRLPVRPMVIWWAGAIVVCAVIVLFYFFAFRDAEQLDALLAQADNRSQGRDLPLPAVLASRAHWIEICFTPLAIWLGKAAVPLLVFRMVALRRSGEVLPLAILAMAAFQYVVFKQGADVHIFWPHYFALYFALALGAIVASVEAVLSRLASQLAPALALGLGLAVPLAILPDGIAGLRYSRMTGGRFDEKGLIIHQDVDKSVVMKWLARRLPPDASVAIDRSMKYSWSLSWEVGRPTPIVWASPKPGAGQPQGFIADARFASEDLLRGLASGFGVRAYGPFWFVDRGAPPKPLVGYALAPREPSAWEWAFVGGNDPSYRILPDPFHTWELRYHLDQTPNPPPTAPPRTRDELRVAHNLAVARGDDRAAARFRSVIEVGLDSRSAGDVGEGIELLGAALEPGVAPRLVVTFLASGPTAHDRSFGIVSRVEARRGWSLVPRDTKDRKVGMPFELPTTLWKPGFLYVSVSEIRQRPGSESYYGRLDGAGHGSRRLLTLP